MFLCFYFFFFPTRRDEDKIQEKHWQRHFVKTFINHLFSCPISNMGLKKILLRKIVRKTGTCLIMLRERMISQEWVHLKPEAG